MQDTAQPSFIRTPRNMATRDLNFVDTDASRARKLTPEQVASFNENGYCHPFTANAPEETAAVRTYFDQLFEKLKATGVTDNYSLVGYQTRCPGLYDLATNSSILDVIEDIMGPNIVCWSSQAFCKVAGEQKPIPFHQDASFWPLTPARTVSAWVAIDDSDIANSCLKVIPGTHRMGALKWKKADWDAAVLDQQLENPLSYGEPKPIELRAGQFSVHADMTAHGSDPNRSDRRRCGFVIRYCPPHVKPLTASWGLNAILCRGVDNEGNWTYWSRPQKDDVSSWRDYWMRRQREGKVAIGSGEGGNIGA